MTNHWITMLCVPALGVLSGQLMFGQVCGVSNTNLTGPYGFVASQSGSATSTTGTTTGTTGTVTTGTGSTGTGTTGTGTTGTGTTGTGTGSTFSDTNIGMLLGDIAAGNQFGLAGIWNFDGAGHINATSPSGAMAAIGTYNVNPDCSISVTLRDAFATGTGTTTSSATTTSSTQLAGVILGRGAEIDLKPAASLQSQTSTTGTGTTGTGTTGTTTTTTTQSAGLTIKLTRTLYSNGCSVSNVNGLYGLVLNPIGIAAQSSDTTGTGTTGTGTTGTSTTGNDTTTTTSSTVDSSAILGYLDFDGAGHIVALPVATSSTPTGTTPFTFNPAPAPMTFASLDFTGTYTVNADCSGTMTINNASASSSTGTGTTGTGTTGTGTTTSTSQAFSIDFVITPAATSAPNASGNPNSNAVGSPELSLSFSNSDQAGWGYALPQ